MQAAGALADAAAGQVSVASILSGGNAAAAVPAAPRVLSPHTPGTRWPQVVRDFVWQKSQEVGLKSAPFNVHLASDIDAAGIRQGMWVAGDMHPLENVLRQILQREEVKHGLRPSEKRDRKIDRKSGWEDGEQPPAPASLERRRSVQPASNTSSDELRGPELENVWREIEANPGAVPSLATSQPPAKRTRNSTANINANSNNNSNHEDVATEVRELKELIQSLSRRQDEVLEMLKVMLPLHVQIHSAVIPDQPTPPQPTGAGGATGASTADGAGKQ